jgi:hypothetical protein
VTPHDGGVAAPGVAVQRAQVRDPLGAQWIQTDVAAQLPNVRLRFADDGVEAVLEEMAHALVAAIASDRIARQKPAHELREARRPAPEQGVRVIGEERPGVDRGPGGLRHRNEAPHADRAVRVVLDDHPAVEAAQDHVMQPSRGIETRLATGGGCARGPGGCSSGPSSLYLRGRGSLLEN